MDEDRNVKAAELSHTLEETLTDYLNARSMNADPKHLDLKRKAYADASQAVFDFLADYPPRVQFKTTVQTGPKLGAPPAGFAPPNFPPVGNFPQASLTLSYWIAGLRNHLRNMGLILTEVKVAGENTPDDIGATSRKLTEMAVSRQHQFRPLPSGEPGIHFDDTTILLSPDTLSLK